MTFSEFIISEKGKEFYLISLEQISQSNSTLEKWFKDLYYDWNLLYNKSTEKYQSTKVFDNYSCAIRQWRALSHCSKNHGYSFKFKIWFEADSLDETNWVQDFGGFKSVPEGNGLKDWMNYMWDHTQLIEKDDPMLDYFKMMEVEGICQLRILDKMGAENMAKMVFDKFNEVLSKQNAGRVRVVKVECFENEKNSSIYTL